MKTMMPYLWLKILFNKITYPKMQFKFYKKLLKKIKKQHYKKNNN